VKGEWKTGIKGGAGKRKRNLIQAGGMVKEEARSLGTKVAGPLQREEGFGRTGKESRYLHKTDCQGGKKKKDRCLRTDSKRFHGPENNRMKGDNRNWAITWGEG